MPNYKDTSLHPFGELLLIIMERKNITQAKLAGKCESIADPTVLNRMLKGERLSGTQAKKRIREIIQILHIEGVLRGLDEANSLLRRADKKDFLDEANKEDVEIILQLKAKQVENKKSLSALTSSEIEYLEILQNYILNIVRSRNHIVDLIGHNQTLANLNNPRDLAAWISKESYESKGFISDSSLGGKISLEDLLKTRNHIVVTGAPGAGKTFTLCALALLAIDKCLNGKSDRIPIFAQLKNYMLPLYQIEKFLKEEIVQRVGANHPIVQDFTFKLNSGRWLILLDGQNEMKDRRHILRNKHLLDSIRQKGLIPAFLDRQVSDQRELEIVRLGDEYSNIELVITCRDHEYNLIPRWCKFILLPLDEYRIQDFIKRHLDIEKSTSLITQLFTKKNLKLRGLITNPFYLSILVEIYNLNMTLLPSTRTELLKALLVKNFKREKILVESFDEVSQLKLTQNLANTAYHLFLQQPKDPVLEISYFLSFLSEEDLHNSYNLGILIELRQNSTILACFYHQLIQEFLISLKVIEMWQKYISYLNSGNHKKAKRLLYKLDTLLTGGWEQVFSYAAGLLQDQKTFLDTLTYYKGTFGTRSYRKNIRANAVKFILNETTHLSSLEMFSISKENNTFINKDTTIQHLIRNCAAGLKKLFKKNLIIRSLSYFFCWFLISTRIEGCEMAGARGLGFMVGSRAAFRRLEKYFNRATKSTKWSVVVAVATLELPDAYNFLLHEFLYGDRHCQYQACIGLLLLKNPEFIGPLLEQIDSPDLELRWYVHYALGKIGDERALAALKISEKEFEDFINYWDRFSHYGKTITQISIERIEARLIGYPDPYEDIIVCPGD